MLKVYIKPIILIIYYIDSARTKSEALVYAFWIYFTQQILNHCKEIHKSKKTLGENHITEKHKTWACNQLKANHWSAEYFIKNMQPHWVGTWPHDTVMCPWSVDTFLDSCQLTIIWMSIIKLTKGYRLSGFQTS